MSEAFPSSFDMQHFRWGDSEPGGTHALEYVGFGMVIRIALDRLAEGGFAVGPIGDPPLQGRAAHAFAQCGGPQALARAAHWFANSR